MKFLEKEVHHPQLHHDEDKSMRVVGGRHNLVEVEEGSVEVCAKFLGTLGIRLKEVVEDSLSESPQTSGLENVDIDDTHVHEDVGPEPPHRLHVHLTEDDEGFNRENLDSAVEGFFRVGIDRRQPVDFGGYRGNCGRS